MWVQVSRLWYFGLPRKSRNHWKGSEGIQILHPWRLNGPWKLTPWKTLFSFATAWFRVHVVLCRVQIKPAQLNHVFLPMFHPFSPSFQSFPPFLPMFFIRFPCFSSVFYPCFPCFFPYRTKPSRRDESSRVALPFGSKGWSLRRIALAKGSSSHESGGGSTPTIGCWTTSRWYARSFETAVLLPLLLIGGFKIYVLCVGCIWSHSTSFTYSNKTH